MASRGRTIAELKVHCERTIIQPTMKLRVVESATPDTILREAFEALSEAERDVRRLKEIIAAEGRVLWSERNPGQTLFGPLRIEAIRQMVER